MGRRFWAKTWAMIRRRKLDREFGEEIDFHLAMLAREFRERGLGLVLLGLTLGLAASVAAARAVSTLLLFGIRPSDPASFVATALVLAAVGIGAALVPARRAAALDPMRALRQE